MKPIILFLMLMNFAFAAGGDQIGNGGDVIICDDKVEMLDMFEATDDSVTVDLGGDQLDYVEKVLYVLEKVGKFQPERTKMYMEWFSTFQDEVKFRSNVKLPDIVDSGVIIIPESCRVEQIAIQMSDEEVELGYPRYVINKNLWDRLDENNKAVLILHEIIYREGILSKQVHSMRVRKMTELFINKDHSQDKFLKMNMIFKGILFEINEFLIRNITWEEVVYGRVSKFFNVSQWREGNDVILEFNNLPNLSYIMNSGDFAGCRYQLSKDAFSDATATFNLTRMEVLRPYDESLETYSCNELKLEGLRISSRNGFEYRLKSDLFKTRYASLSYGKSVSFYIEETSPRKSALFSIKNKQLTVIQGKMTVSDGRVFEGHFTYDLTTNKITRSN